MSGLNHGESEHVNRVILAYKDGAEKQKWLASFDDQQQCSGQPKSFERLPDAIAYAKIKALQEGCEVVFEVVDFSFN